MGKPDMAKERRWREVLRRFEASDLGTRRFCARERIPEHQFHWWRRRLRQSCQHAPQRRGAIAQRDIAPHSSSAPSQQGEVAFSPRPAAASRLGRAAAPESPFWSVSTAQTLSVPLEIIHPRGHVIRVPALFDAAALERLLMVLDRLNSAEGAP